MFLGTTKFGGTKSLAAFGISPECRMPPRGYGHDLIV